MLPKNSPIFKSWNVIYPVFIYFVVTNLSMSLFTIFAVFLGADPTEQYMMLQTASVAVTIPLLLGIIRKIRQNLRFFGSICNWN